jgi:formate hydrogenlyase transcriptional activator
MGVLARLEPEGYDRRQRRFEQIIGKSPNLNSVLEQVERVGPTDSTALIQGETGTGKELIAHAIHNVSRRCGRPFVRMNCAAIPFDLLESELFGHEKGAFTGAVAQKIGRFELADQGTLFLDEVGDIPLGLQPKLLRVLQEQEFNRLGGTRTIRADVRIIAATNRNLVEMVENQQFRIDLYYRLDVFPMVVPPLRERREDIPPLVEHFTAYYAERMHKHIDTICSKTLEQMMLYGWPGNIRELQNVIERAVILSDGPVLRVAMQDVQTRSAPSSATKQLRTLAEAERDHILEALKEADWVLAGPKGAAARLGINRSTLQFRMRKLGIVRPNVMWLAPQRLDPGGRSVNPSNLRMGD